MHPEPTRRIPLLALLAVVALALVGLPEARATEEPVLEGEHVIHYGLGRYQLADSHRILRHGEPRLGGGCTFSGTDELAPGETLAEIEVAYDPETCRSLVEVGTLTSEHGFLEPGAMPEESEERSGEALVTAGAGPAAAVGALQRLRAYNWVWYDEPARWLFDCDVEDNLLDLCLLPPVNTVRNAIEWAPDGSCAVPPGTIGRMEYAITWFSPSGWTVEQDTWEHSPSPIPCDQDIYSRNWNHFNNQVFCQALVNTLPLPITPRVAPTNTYYQPNEVSGNEIGTARFRWSASKDGGCESFLQFGRKADNTRI